MRTPLQRLLFPLLLAIASLGAPQVEGHELPMDARMNSLLRVDGREAIFVVRAPLFLFRSIRFPVRGAEIDLPNAGPAMQRALTALQENLTLFANHQPLQASEARGRLSLPSDRSFGSFERAVAHIEEAPDADAAIVVDQGYVDAIIRYPLPSPDAVISVQTRVAAEGGDFVKLAIRYMPAGHDERAIVINSTSGRVALNPDWATAASGFVGFGVKHIVTGMDHLLFLLCLLIPLRNARQVLAVVTAFTVAHSVTLIGAAFDLAPSGAWFPPFVELAIALSIVYTALENIIGVDLRRRLILTMLFGLVHGFGFSYGLREDLQFAGSHLVMSLLAFNVGIEIGQVLMLGLMLPALALVTRYVLPGKVGMIVLCAILAQVGGNWAAERWDALSVVPWPAPDLADLGLATFWLAVLVLAGAVAVALASRLRFESVSRNGAPSGEASPGD